MPHRTRTDLRENLETKLAIYERFKATLSPEGALIFTNRPEIWRTEKRPFIIASEPLPPFPANYDPARHDVVKEVIDFFRVMFRHPEYHYMCVRIFVLPSNSKQLHIHLSYNRTAQTEPIQTYLKVPIPCSTKSSDSAVKIRAFTYSPEIMGALHPQELEVGIDMRYRQRQIVREVGLHFLSDELKQNLREKVEKFARLVPYDANTGVIFKFSPKFWPEGLKFIVMKHPRAPLPTYGDDYYKENIIPRYILEYVKDVAEELNCSPFYAVCSTKKTKKKPYRWNAHLMFSQYEQSLKCLTDKVYLSTEDPPVKSILRMPIYSNELYTEWYSKTKALFDPEESDDSDEDESMEHDGEDSDTDSQDSETDSRSSSTARICSDIESEEEKPQAAKEFEALTRTPDDWDNLLGRHMTGNLLHKMRTFLRDEDAKKGMPVIFVNALNFWPPNEYKVIPDDPLPPLTRAFSTDLTYRRNATERDLLNFFKWLMKEKSLPPFYVACSKFGMDLCLEPHLLFSRKEEPIRLASRWGCSTTEDPPEVAYKKYPTFSSLSAETPSSQRASVPGPSSGHRSYLVSVDDIRREPVLSLDIKKNLDYKLKLFQSGAPYEKNTAVIFANKAEFWPRGIKFVVLEDPSPPCFYPEMQAFDSAPWARLILDYLKERAQEDGCIPFYASFSRKGFKEQRKQKVELMFSQFKEAFPALDDEDYFTTEDTPVAIAAAEAAGGVYEDTSVGPVLSQMRSTVTQSTSRKAKKRKVGCLPSPLKALTGKKKRRHSSRDRGESRSRSRGESRSSSRGERRSKRERR